MTQKRNVLAILSMRSSVMVLIMANQATAKTANPTHAEGEKKTLMANNMPTKYT